MPRLYLIRHGQASFGHANYDQLSATGKKQSSLISGHFQESVLKDAVFYSGSMERHKETLQLAVGENTNTIFLEGLNEFDHRNVLAVYEPAFAQAESMAQFIMSQPNPRKAFQAHFEKAMHQWMLEENDAYTENFKVFQQRVHSALKNIQSVAYEHSQKEILAFTSGGFIASAVQHILGCSPEKMLELNWRIANASVSTLQFNEKQFSLLYFNNYSHLPQELLSWR